MLNKSKECLVRANMCDQSKQLQDKIEQNTIYFYSTEINNPGVKHFYN